MRYNLILLSGDTRLADRMQTVLALDCAIMPVDPRHDDDHAVARRIEPDGIIVDAGTHTGARTALETIAGARERFGGVPLFVIGDEMSAQLILASFRAGADDFLDRDCSDTELHGAILSRLRDHAARKGHRASATRIDVLSPSPSDEDYDLALNAAAMLAAGDQTRRVLLMDMSLPASPVRLALDTEPLLTIPAAIREMRRLDRAFLDSALGRSRETGLFVLPLADDTADTAALPALHDLSILLQVLRATFDILVVFWGLFSRQAVPAGGDGGRRQVLLCCNQRFASVRNAKALQAELLAGGVAPQDIVLAVHQLAPNLSPAPEDVLRAVGAERSMTLRTSWAALAQAHNQGRPLIMQGASPYGAALRSYLASERLVSDAEPRSPNILEWLRRARVS